MSFSAVGGVVLNPVSSKNQLWSAKTTKHKKTMHHVKDPPNRMLSLVSLCYLPDREGLDCSLFLELVQPRLHGTIRRYFQNGGCSRLASTARFYSSLGTKIQQNRGSPKEDKELLAGKASSGHDPGRKAGSYFKMVAHFILR